MVTAQLLTDAPLPQLSSHGIPLGGPMAASASWVASNGSVQIGLIPVTSGQYAGDHVSIWLDRSGAVTEAPLNLTDAAARAVIVGLGGWLVARVAAGLDIRVGPAPDERPQPGPLGRGMATGGTVVVQPLIDIG